MLGGMAGTLRYVGCAALFASGLVAACTSFDSASEPPVDMEGGALPDAAGGGGETGAAETGGDGNTIGVAGVLYEEGFEPAGGGCGALEVFQATAERDDTTHRTGVASCKFCRVDPMAKTYGQLALPFAGRGPGLYKLEGYVQNGTAAAPANYGFRIDEHYADGGDVNSPYAESKGIAADASFGPAQVAKTATVGDRFVALIYIFEASDAGTVEPCYNLDDLKITYVPK